MWSNCYSWANLFYEYSFHCVSELSYLIQYIHSFSIVICHNYSRIYSIKLMKRFQPERNFQFSSNEFPIVRIRWANQLLSSQKPKPIVLYKRQNTENSKTATQHFEGYLILCNKTLNSMSSFQIMLWKATRYLTN